MSEIIEKRFSFCVTESSFDVCLGNRVNTKCKLIKRQKTNKYSVVSVYKGIIILCDNNSQRMWKFGI